MLTKDEKEKILWTKGFVFIPSNEVKEVEKGDIIVYRDGCKKKICSLKKEGVFILAGIAFQSADEPHEIIRCGACFHINNGVVIMGTEVLGIERK